MLRALFGSPNGDSVLAELRHNPAAACAKHQLVRDMTMSLTYPDGRKQDLIRIDDWDFSW
jgi:hypothetical protein